LPAIPFPPVHLLGLPEFAALANMPMAGVTFDHMYFVHEGHDSMGLHFHELIHVLQWQTLGVKRFLLAYALGILEFGYQESPLEAIAYQLQAEYERGAAMPPLFTAVSNHAKTEAERAARVFASHGLRMTN
jgi:hypothetical protein